MSGYDMQVPPRSWDNINASAQSVRENFRLTDIPKLPIMELLEKVMWQSLNIVRLEVCTHAEMDGALGATSPTAEFIRLREDVYEGAWAGNGRDRFTVAHELGHWDLHTNVLLHRVELGKVLKPYEASEPQANHYAACILMPEKFIRAGDSARELATRFGVSEQSAELRLGYLRRKGKL